MVTDKGEYFTQINLQHLQIAHTLQLADALDDIVVVHVFPSPYRDNERQRVIAASAFTLLQNAAQLQIMLPRPTQKGSQRHAGVQLNVDLHHIALTAQAEIQPVQHSQYCHDSHASRNRRLVQADSSRKAHAGRGPEPWSGP